VLTIDIINLCGPKQKHDKVVASTKKCDEKDDNHCLLGLAKERLRYHRIGCEKLPHEESDEKNNAEDQWSEVVRAAPWVLIIISDAPCN
jgi:hypothetical protein